jgi:hypothetical protein
MSAMGGAKQRTLEFVGFDEKFTFDFFALCHDEVRILIFDDPAEL